MMSLSECKSRGGKCVYIWCFLFFPSYPLARAGPWKWCLLNGIASALSQRVNTLSQRPPVQTFKTKRPGSAWGSLPTPRASRPPAPLQGSSAVPPSRHLLARRLTREPEKRECKTRKARNKPAPPAQSQSLAMTTPEVRRGAPPAHAPPRSRGPASGRKRL